MFSKNEYEVVIWLILFNMVLIGLVLPSLISARSNIMVFTGIGLIFLLIYCDVKTIISIAKKVSRKEKKNEYEDF